MDDRPTLPAWVSALVAELQTQIDRLYSGRACRECRGSGETTQGGKAGVYVRACGACDGAGVTADRPH